MFLLVSLLIVSCNANAPDKAIVDILDSIDGMQTDYTRYESAYISCAKWQSHVYEDFNEAFNIVSEEPIDYRKVADFRPIDGLCYPHNYIMSGLENSVSIAELAGIHDVLIKFMSQLQEKIELKKGLLENRELFKYDKKFNASIGLVDKSINASIGEVQRLCNHLINENGQKNNN